MSSRKLFWLWAGGFSAILLLVAACAGGSPTPRPASVGGFSLSPDGRFLNFGYSINRNGVSSSGTRQLDWRTGQVTRQAEAPFQYRRTSDPNIVYRRLPDDRAGGVSLEGISLYDYPSFELKRTIKLSQMPEENARWAAATSPWKSVEVIDVNVDAKQALCRFSGSTGSGLCLYDLTTGKYSILVPPEMGFDRVNSQRLLGRDDVFFSAASVKDERLKTELGAIGKSLVSSYAPVPYRVKAGGKPQIVYEDILRRSVDIGSGTPTSYASSCDGKRMAFIAISPGEDEPMKRARLERRGYAYRLDVYVRDGDTQRAVTNVKTYLSHVAISCDGSTVAFGTYAAPPGVTNPGDEYWSRRQFEPNVVDLNTNQLVRPHLVDRLLNEPGLTKD